jgi:hypothetical protein
MSYISRNFWKTNYIMEWVQTKLMSW